MTKTHGTSVKAVAMLPSAIPALAGPIFWNSMPVRSGKIPPSKLRQQLCAARAEDAYAWYTSAR
jgi:small neutral amino acid transporter SnatA (MarC family)